MATDQKSAVIQDETSSVMREELRLMNNKNRNEYGYRSNQRSDRDDRYDREEASEFARGGQFRDIGPKGYQRSDERIKEDVCDFLMQAPNIDCSEMEVSVDNGVVTLKGTVEERPMKRQAEEAIEYVPGVQDVRNELRVQVGGQGKAESHGVRQSQRPQKHPSDSAKSKRGRLV